MKRWAQTPFPLDGPLSRGGIHPGAPPSSRKFKMKSCLLFCLLATPALVFSATPPRLRLPLNARPERYALDLTLVPGERTFHGAVDIDIRFTEPTSLLWLNGEELEIRSAELKRQGKSAPAQVVAGGKQFTGFSFSQPVSGKATLHIVYTGRISANSSAGVFELNDKGIPYVFTQFEPTDARRAFPCFDEPIYKVPWQITLHVRKEQMALANTPVISETDEPGGLKAVRFAESKPLPSYLVAFAAGPFEAVDAGKVGSTPLRVIVPQGRSGEAKYAAEVIPQLLRHLVDYFGSPYPFEKLDSLCMPISNFAMENAGLITYGQSILLSSPENDTIGRQRDFAITAAHEMAHQWFGDLVTTSWWNDIWLNEAFATWMESKIIGAWKPEWRPDVTRVEDTLGAMNLDSLVSTRKIRQPIESDDDIANAFDGITYQKGAAVINMFESWVGAEKFRQGVGIYMKRYGGGNASTAQFLGAISEAAGHDIAPAFGTFLDHAGVPVVSLRLDCAGPAPKLELEQKRSLPLGSSGSAPDSWQIPVCVSYEAGGKENRQCDLLADRKSDMTLHAAAGCPAWVIGNAGENGYYRVNYQSGLLEKVLGGNGEHLTVAERVGELGNVRALVSTGDVPPDVALAFTPGFAKDSHREVVEAAVEIAQMLNSAYVPASLRPSGARYVRNVFGERAISLGWSAKPGESEDTRLLRQSLVPFVASVGEEQPLIQEAGALARQWLKDRRAVHPDMVSSVLDVAAEFGNQNLFESFLTAVRKEPESRGREQLFRALSAFRDPAIVRQSLALLLTGEFDARESFILLYGPLAYPETRDLPFDFVRQNIDRILAHLPREVGEDFAANLPGAGGAFCDIEHRDQVRDFFQPRIKDYTGGARTLAQVLESIDLCIGARRTMEPGLAKFLSGY